MLIRRVGVRGRGWLVIDIQGGGGNAKEKVFRLEISRGWHLCKYKLYVLNSPSPPLLSLLSTSLPFPN